MMGTEENQHGLLSGPGDGLDAVPRRNPDLEAENRRLRLALALLQWKREPKQRGRKLKNKPEDNESLLQAVETVLKLLRERNLPSLCRRLNREKPLSERLSRADLEDEIKTLQNRMAEARRLRK